MSNKDCETLRFFIERTGMFIGEQNQEKIVSFEIGRNEECDFTRKISDHCKKEYGIERRALGWPYQITTLAERINEDWITVFKRESLVVINKASS